MLLVQFGSGNLGRHDRPLFYRISGRKHIHFSLQNPSLGKVAPALLGDMCSWRPLSPGWGGGVAGLYFCHRVRRGSYSGREFLGSITLPPWLPFGCSFFQWFCGSSFSALYTENDNVALFKPDLISAAAALAYFTVADLLLLPYNPTVGPAILLFYRREREREREREMPVAINTRMSAQESAG